MKVNPNVQIILGVVVALLYAAAKGQIGLPLGVPAEWGAYISSWANWLTGIYLVVAPLLPAFSSSVPGPLAPPDPPVVQAATQLASATTLPELVAAKTSLNSEIAKT